LLVCVTNWQNLTRITDAMASEKYYHWKTVKRTMNIDLGIPDGFCDHSYTSKT